MNWLAEVCVRRPVFATVLILILVVFGLWSYFKLGVDQFPKIDIPMITVMTRQPGAAPEEIETDITDKIEEAVNTVSGIEDLRSVSAEGVSLVYIGFVMEKDVDVAAQDVRDRINRILPDLPKDVEQPTVEKMDPDSIPVMTIAVSAPPPATIRDITEYCDKLLRRRLETVSGVGQVSIIGGQLRQINLKLDPQKLRAYGLTVAHVARAVAAENLQMPSGSLKQGATEYTIRTLGRVEQVEGMRLLTVANRDGRSITVGDLGDVEDAGEEAKSLAQFNEGAAVLLNVRKQSGTNTVEVIHQVKERLEELCPLNEKGERVTRDGYRIEVVRDQSVFIEASLAAVQEHLLLGGFLAGVVVLLFLGNLRATLIAGVAIPTSIIATYSILLYMGFTLNMITLLALTLSVGIVIDDAIVVMENIFRFIEKKGYRPFDAAIAATAEIGLAVLAITLSLVAVFLPIALMGGIVGQFLKSFGITMAATVMASMLVGFTLTPSMASRWFKPLKEGEGGEHAGHEASGPGWISFYRYIEAVYGVMLRFSLRHRWVVVLAIVASLASIVPLMSVARVNFLPVDDRSDFEVSVQAFEGTTLEATGVLVARMAREIRGVDGVRYTIASAADDEQRSANKGRIYVKLVDIKDRTFSQQDAMAFVREQILPKYTADGLRVSVAPSSEFGGGGMANADVQITIGGPDMRKLETTARRVMEDLRKVPGAVDVDSSMTTGKPQYGVRIDRAKAAEMGVSVADIANTLRLLVAGDKVTNYNEGGQQYEVHVRATPEDRNEVEDLAMVTVPSAKLGTVPLGDVVSFQKGDGPAQINRLNRTREVSITTNLGKNTSQKIVQDAIHESFERQNLGPDYVCREIGKSREMAKMLRGFAMVFGLSFLLVYLILAAQFESWLHPITILLSLPLTVPFAIISLIVFNQSVNIFSLLGVLVLFAVVKKNSILQIDHTNQLREHGMSRYDAMIAANMDRLRPILMTTIAFVAGMLPLLLSNGAGAATNKAISAVVIGGQTLSLLLTLLATPVAYSLFDDLANIRLWRRREPQAEEGESREEPAGHNGRASGDTSIEGREETTVCGVDELLEVEKK